MISLLKFFVIIWLIYYALRFILRFVLPWLLGRYVNKKMEEMGQFRQSNNQKKNTRTGEVTINVESKNKKQYSKNSGEYIDFEEIK